MMAQGYEEIWLYGKPDCSFRGLCVESDGLSGHEGMVGLRIIKAN
jgi:hypothetical protein